MAIHTLKGLFSDIADSMRLRFGLQGQLIADNFPTYVDSLPEWSGEKGAIPISKPTSLMPSETYTGFTITNGVDSTGTIVTGDISGINAGTYTSTYTPDENHVWSDTFDRSTITVVLTINRAPVGANPSTSVSHIFYGYASTVTNGYTCPAGVTPSGTSSTSSFGVHYAYYTPDSNHCWTGGGTEQATIIMYVQGYVKSNINYGFDGSHNNWYSTNYHVASSTGYARFSFYFVNNTTVYVDFRSNGESNYDYEMISYLDTTMSTSSDDNTTGVWYTTRGNQGTTYTATYTFSGSHFFDIKYRKDYSVDTEPDRGYISRIAW